MTPRSAYALRATVRHRYSNWADVPMTPERAAALGPGYVYSFAAAWDRALACGVQLQADAATPLAIEGERVPIVWRGAVIGWRRRFNDRLTLAAIDAYRRVHEGPSLDHDHRIARRTAEAADKIERLLRLGPIRWPDPAPPEDPDARRDRLRHARQLDRHYGKPKGGLRDAMRPAGSPMRTLAEQDAARQPRRVHAAPASDESIMKLLDRAMKFHETREKCEAKADWREPPAPLKRGDAPRHRTKPAAPPS
ncbi:MAG: hypothetical protein EON93_03655 [Burkholderiales bacterium]|nr:MAG: hypothetical protein EON93_03655 [Burkholderiales bacterium]